MRPTTLVLVAMSLVLITGCASRTRTSGDPARARETAEACNARGLAHIESGRWPDAEAAFREAVSADPYFGPGHCNLGLTLLQQGNYHDAGWELRHASQLMPRAAQPRVALGLLYEAVGRFGPAEDHLREALRIEPDDVEICGYLARLHVRQGRLTSETLGWLELVTVEASDDEWRTWANLQLTRQTEDATLQRKE